MTEPTTRRTVLIAHNPRAGARMRAAYVQVLRDRLIQDGWHAESVTDLAELHTSATELWNEGRLRAVVAAGGDGTVAAVANRAPLGTPLIVYPLGTENLIAKYFGYKRRPESIAALLASGEEIAIDAGQAGSQLFVLMISAGFDAEVVRRVAEARVGHIRRWTYAKPLLTAMRSYRYPELRIQWKIPPELAPASAETAGGSAAARWVFAMNLSKYAFGLNFAPAASGTDGLLDVCTFSQGSVFHGFRYVWGVFLRQHLKYADACLTRCNELRIEAADGEKVPYQLDGDFGGFLPVTVRVLPGRLRFVVHQTTAARLTSCSP